MSQPSSTLQRLERLLTVVPWLLEHPGADVARISERLGVPREELLADLDLLGYCGLPGYGGGDLIEVSIVGDHVTLRMADFFRRPLRLSLREAVTLLLAARALGGVEGLAESAPLRRAAERPETALGATGAAGGPGQQGSARVAVQLADAGQEHLATLRTAIAMGRVVRLVYRSESRATTSERDVDPWSLTAAHGSWYLQGHCRAARGPRDFRLDRIKQVALTPERSRPPPAALPAPTYRRGPDDPVVVLDCDPEISWLAEWAKADVSVDRHTGRPRMTFAVDHLEWAARLVLRLEGRAEVRSPAALGTRVRTIAVAALQQYEDHLPT